MSHIYQKRPNTRLLIIKTAAQMFIEDGYSATSVSQIAKRLDLSTGNVTFYFHTKEDLFAVLVDELFDFQNLIMDKEAAEGKSSMSLS